MDFGRFVVTVLALLGASGTASAEPVQMAYAVPQRTFIAPEARQGVASDGTHVYAVDNSTIVRYALDSGKPVASFKGDPKLFPHMNSCTLIAQELVCAASNYPAVPQIGSVEFFDPVTLAHRKTVPLPANPGSFTTLMRRDGQWWGSFAQYDGKGGAPGTSHRDTLIVQMDDTFAVTKRWTMPPSVLDRLAPKSLSGLAWGKDGKLYVSGHDKPEIYVLDVPQDGGALRHIATFPVATFGQAIDFDPRDPTLLWSIDRERRALVASRITLQPAPLASAGGE